MTLKIFPFLLSTSVYFALAIWFIGSHTKRLQRLYGAICLVTSAWQSIWIILLSQMTPLKIALCSKVCYTVLVFIPPIFHHFIVEFKQEKARLRTFGYTYGVSFVFVLLIWSGTLFIKGFRTFTWGMSPVAGPLYSLFVVFITFHLFRILVLLRHVQRDPGTSDMRRRHAKWV